MNESDESKTTSTTDIGVKMTPEQLETIKSLPLFGRHFHYVAPAPSRSDWLLERYPANFVRALMEGGRCDLRSRAETLPLLDAYPWSWVDMVRSAYAIFVEGVAIDMHQVAMALREFAEAGLPTSAAQKYDPQEKDRELAQGRKAARAEGRMGQPWRKKHR